VRCLCQVNPAIIIDCAEQTFGGIVGFLAVGGILECKERQVAIRHQVKIIQLRDRGGGLFSPDNMVPNTFAEALGIVHSL